MAEFGAKLPCFQPEGRATGVVLGKLVTANLAVTLASGEIYADDAVAESLSEFAEGALAMETDDMTDAVADTVYGATVTGGGRSSTTRMTRLPRGSSRTTKSFCVAGRGATRRVSTRASKRRWGTMTRRPEGSRSRSTPPRPVSP